MSGLKCDFPEGCQLDLYSTVVKAKFIERQAKVLDTTFCIPDSGPNGVNGKIDEIKDIKYKVLEKNINLSLNKAKIQVKYEIILFVLVEGCYQVVTVADTFEMTVQRDEFDPPLTRDEFRNEVDEDESVLILCNWDFDYEIKGDCEDFDSPCRFFGPCNGPFPPGPGPFPPGPGPFPPGPGPVQPDSFPPGPFPPGPFPPGFETGTCLQLVAYTDIILKLGKLHDIVVYGELDPETEC